MIPFIMMALSLAQKKQQQDQVDNAKISDSLNLGDRNQQPNNYQLQVPNNNMLGGQQGGAIGLLGSLFNKKDPT